MSAWFFRIGLLCLLLSFGVPLEADDLKRETWKIENVPRDALVYVPKSNDKKNPPLVFVFHGHGGRAEFSVRKFAIHEHWPDAVCVYPQGLPTPAPVIDPEGKRSGWQKHAGDQNDRDLNFYDAMLKSMKADHHIDETSVFSCGHSNGGFFTYVLWAARGDTLAAVAPVAAYVNPRDFANLKPKPVFHVAGEADRIVKFSFQERTMEQLRKLNQCDAEGKPAGNFCIKYGSKNGHPVITFTHPGGHEIPDGAPEQIAKFFQEQCKK